MVPSWGGNKQRHPGLSLTSCLLRDIDMFSVATDKKRFTNVFFVLNKNSFYLCGQVTNAPVPVVVDPGKNDI